MGIAEGGNSTRRHEEDEGQEKGGGCFALTPLLLPVFVRFMSSCQNSVHKVTNDFDGALEDSR
jgi:hypothetical protein